jgi:hypothetical protein
MLDSQDKLRNTSWVYLYAHHSQTNGAVAEALNTLGLEHPGDVIIEPSSYTPDCTPVYTTASVSDRTNTRALRSPNREGRFVDGRPCIRVRSITTGMFNELMKASTLVTSHKSGAWLLEALMGLLALMVETQDEVGC